MFLLSETVKQPFVSILAIPRRLSFVIKHGSGLRNKSESESEIRKESMFSECSLWWGQAYSCHQPVLFYKHEGPVIITAINLLSFVSSKRYDMVYIFQLALPESELQKGKEKLESILDWNRRESRGAG